MKTIRKDYQTKSCAPKDALGWYLTESVQKKWTEDFVDEASGEVVSIERFEILAAAGKMVDMMMVPEFADAGIREIKVCNIPRAFELPHTFGVVPYAVKVRSCYGGCRTVVVRADSIYNAMKCAVEWCCDYENGVWGEDKPNEVRVTDVQQITGIRFLSRTDEELEAERKAVEADPSTEVKTPYKVQASYVNFSLSKPKRVKFDYVVWAYDVAGAKGVAYDYVKHVRGNDTIEFQSGQETLKIVRAVPYKCDAYVPWDVCNEWFINPKINKIDEARA